MLRLIVAEDHRAVREALVKLLERESDIVVVGQAAGGAEAVRCVRSLPADILLLDLSMPEMDGLDVLAALEGQSRPRVIVVSLNHSPAVIERALDAGAYGYVTKQAALSELIPAIHAVAAGRHYLCAVARAKLATQ